MTCLTWPFLSDLQLNYAGCVMNCLVCQVGVNQHSTRGSRQEVNSFWIINTTVLSLEKHCSYKAVFTAIVSQKSIRLTEGMF